MSRVFREAFYGIKRHAAMTFSSVSAVTMTLFIVGAFIILNANLQHVVSNVENTVQIHAKIETSVDDNGIKSLQKKIEGLPNVKKVIFSSKDEELDYFIQSYGEQGSLFEMYVGENNPMRNAFLVEANMPENIQSVAAAVASQTGIESVNYGGDGTIKLIESMSTLRLASYGIVAVLAVIAILLITNTIDTTIAARSQEIFIMRTVGASNGFIRGPFVMEGILIGFLGAILPIAVLAGGYYWGYDMLNGQLLSSLFTLVEPQEFVMVMAASLLLGGVVVGAIGSSIAVSKKLRWKR